MGTRSNTIVLDGKAKLVNMYRHMDGYPSGHGIALVEFLRGLKLCNGFGLKQCTGRWANGAGCLAAQMVAHFKNGIGGFYLSPINDGGNDYTYEVHVETPDMGGEGRVTVAVKTGRKTLFKGDVEQFKTFCEKEE